MNFSYQDEIPSRSDAEEILLATGFDDLRAVCKECAMETDYDQHEGETIYRFADGSSIRLQGR